jgi:mevalonate kinase
LGVIASAPAKIILFGEHFVVYGEPAVVLAIDKRAYASADMRKDKRIYINSVDLGMSGFFEGENFYEECGGQTACRTLEPLRIAIQKVLERSKISVGVSVKVRSSIPVAAGLGSSAAVAAAVATAVGRLLDLELSKEEIFHISYEAERFVHGTPSGIDPTISTYGGVLLYQKNKGFTQIKVKGEIPLVIGDTKVKRSTGDLVASVYKRRNQYPSIIKLLLKIGGKIALRAVKALETGDLYELGQLMNINHGLLYTVGVSDVSLERLVYAARGADALGAKLTGAGGGGCMIALAKPNKLAQVVDAIEHMGGRAFDVGIADEGVRIGD